MKKHVVLVKENSRHEKAASRSLTYLGRYKHGGLVYGDMGLKKNWEAYQKELRLAGLPAARG